MNLMKNYPTNIPGLYYAYHIMVGLGTIFIALMLASIVQLFRKIISNKMDFMVFTLHDSISIYCQYYRLVYR